MIATKGRKGVDYYAVQYRDMGKAYMHLLGFKSKANAEDCLASLTEFEQQVNDSEIDDVDYELILTDILNSADAVEDEIDYRRNIDENGIYTNIQDEKWKIINYPYWVDLYL